MSILVCRSIQFVIALSILSAVASADGHGHWSERRNVISAPGTTSVISEREFCGFKDYGANDLARLRTARHHGRP